jgi:hypothetical protein
MSYLKTFETFHYSNLHRPNLIKIKVDELKDFCETYLAYLMDDSIKELKVGKPRLLQTDKYVCYNVEIYFNKSVHWDKIKDHFLPFLQMVQKEYVFREDNKDKMCSIAWEVQGLNNLSISIPYTLQELLDDEVESEFDNPMGKIVGNVGSIKLDILEEVSKD